MKFLADEDFNGKVVRGLIRRLPDIDLVRVQDTAAYQQGDDVVFAISVATGRVLLTHDVNTMHTQIDTHLEDEIDFPGVIFARQSLSIGVVIDELEYIAEVGTEEDFRNSYRYLPL